MEKEQLLLAAKALCRRWQAVHDQLLQADNDQKKSQLLYEESTLERSFHSMLADYCACVREERECSPHTTKRTLR